MIVTKNDITRDINPLQVEEYLAAGWKQAGAKKELDVAVKSIKPTAQATAAVIEAIGDNLDNQGD